MDNSINFELAVGAIGGFVSLLLGGFDTILKVCMLLMVMDVVFGFVSAAFFNVSKYSKNGLKSEAMWKGIIRKISMLCIITLGVMVDKVLGVNYVRNAVVMYFIASEGLSLLEHMIHIGVPFPAFIKTILETILEKSEEGNV